MKKLRKYLRSLVVGLLADLRLCFGLEEPPGYGASFDPHGLQSIAEKGAAGWYSVVGVEPGMSSPGQVVPYDPLGHKTRLPRPDVLVRYENVPCSGGVEELLEEQVRLGDLLSRGKWPVASHSFAAHTPGIDDARI